MTQILRIGLPVLSVVLLAGAFLLSPKDIEDTFSLPLDRERILADGLRVLSPAFEGTTPAGEAYTVKAEWALPDGPEAQYLTLHNLQGTLDLSDGTQAILEAGHARARPDDKALSLSDNVTVTTSDGYVMTTQTAVVDGVANTVQSDTPVQGRSVTKGQTLNAGNMQIVRDIDTNTVIARFGDGVTVVFDPNQEGTTQ